MAPLRSKKRRKLLASTRPSVKHKITNNNNNGSKARPTSLSSRTTQAIISTHHTLHKQLAQAKKRNADPAAVAALEAAIEANGGLDLYQRASVTGQSRQRGGDTSKVLVEWLGLLEDNGCRSRNRRRRRKAETETETETETQLQLQLPDRSRDNGGGDKEKKEKNKDKDKKKKKNPVLRILEVGALSASNALNIPGRTLVRRIDLHSQDTAAIEQVDFMALDPQQPWAGAAGAAAEEEDGEESGCYHVVSLSLVLNYVGEPAARGRMLEHTLGFLRPRLRPRQEEEGEGEKEEKNELLPALFLVLPRPCIDNSRYLSEERLVDIMRALGYVQTRVRRSPRLYYSLWTLRTALDDDDNDDNETKVFKKVQVRSGNDRNNFCIVLDPDDDEH